MKSEKSENYGGQGNSVYHIKTIKSYCRIVNSKSKIEKSFWNSKCSVKMSRVDK